VIVNRKQKTMKTIEDTLKDCLASIEFGNALGRQRLPRALRVLSSSVELATQRYVGGRSSYYEVLQAQQELYPTQRAQVQAQLGESIATVQLYKTLGGGIVVQYLSKQ